MLEIVTPIEITSLTKVSDAYKAEIFIGGGLQEAIDICQRFCERGLCVTVEPTMFVYTGGRESGVRVGLINYARFPKSRKEIRLTAMELALELKDGLGQGSYTIQDDEKSVFFSTRVEDGCVG